MSAVPNSQTSANVPALAHQKTDAANPVATTTIQDQAKVIKPSQRIFISGANSLLGHSLFEELRNDHIAIMPDAEELENRFYVTLN